MLIFLAAVNSDDAVRATRAAGVKNYLFSFGMGREIFKKNAEVLADPTCNVLVDSGAFSVWGTGKKIDINEYAAFCHELAANSRCNIRFVNLDVIPGKPSRYVTGRQREDSARRGWENFLRLREMGLQVMPVFHQFESFEWLKRIAAAESDYIGISPSNDDGVPEIRTHYWLHRVFRRLGYDGGVRTHCFGQTGARYLHWYPFYSADSTTWNSGAKRGSIVEFSRRTLAPTQVPLKDALRRSGPYLRLDKHVVPFIRSKEYRLWKGAQTFLEFERFLTERWEKQGLRWPQRFGDATPRGAELRRPAHLSGPSDAVESHAELIKEVLGVKQKSKRKLSDLLDGMRDGLKGARLSVWMAYCLNAGSDGVALDIDDLKSDTGYDDDAIERARPWLRRNGWLVRMKEVPDPRNQGAETKTKFVRHPDQTRGDSGGKPDHHVTVIPSVARQRASRTPRREEPS